MTCQDPYRNVRNFGHAKYGRQGSFVGHNGGDGTWDTLGLYVFCGQKKLGLGVCKEITGREACFNWAWKGGKITMVFFPHGFHFLYKSPFHITWRSEIAISVPKSSTASEAWPLGPRKKIGHQLQLRQVSRSAASGKLNLDKAQEPSRDGPLRPGFVLLMYDLGIYETLVNLLGIFAKKRWFSLDFWTCPKKRERVSTRICETFSWAVFLKLLLLKLLLLPLQVPLRLSLLRHRMVAGCWLMLNLCCDSKSSWCFSLTLVGDQQLTAIHLNFSRGKRCACKKDLGRSSLCPSCDELCLVQLRLLCIDACRSGPYIAIHCLRT